MRERIVIEVNNERDGELVHEMLHENGFVQGKGKVRVCGMGVCSESPIFTR